MSSETHTYRDYDRSKRRNILDLKEPWNLPLCLFSGFLRHRSKTRRRRRKRRKKSKERYISTCIVRYYAELKKSTTGKSTSCNDDNNRYAKGKHKRTQALLFCPLSNPNSYFSFLILGPVYSSGFGNLKGTPKYPKYPKFVQFFFFFWVPLNQSN